jgi:hypothetical protein
MNYESPSGGFNFYGHISGHIDLLNCHTALFQPLFTVTNLYPTAVVYNFGQDKYSVLILISNGYQGIIKGVSNRYQAVSIIAVSRQLDLAKLLKNHEGSYLYR